MRHPHSTATPKGGTKRPSSLSELRERQRKRVAKGPAATDGANAGTTADTATGKAKPGGQLAHPAQRQLSISSFFTGTSASSSSRPPPPAAATLPTLSLVQEKYSSTTRTLASQDTLVLTNTQLSQPQVQSQRLSQLSLVPTFPLPDSDDEGDGGSKKENDTAHGENNEDDSGAELDDAMARKASVLSSQFLRAHDADQVPFVCETRDEVRRTIASRPSNPFDLLCSQEVIDLTEDGDDDMSARKPLPDPKPRPRGQLNLKSLLQGVSTLRVQGATLPIACTESAFRDTTFARDCERRDDGLNRDYAASDDEDETDAWLAAKMSDAEEIEEFEELSPVMDLGEGDGILSPSPIPETAPESGAGDGFMISGRFRSRESSGTGDGEDKMDDDMDNPFLNSKSAGSSAHLRMPRESPLEHGSGLMEHCAWTLLKSISFQSSKAFDWAAGILAMQDNPWNLAAQFLSSFAGDAHMSDSRRPSSSSGLDALLYHYRHPEPGAALAAQKATREAQIARWRAALVCGAARACQAAGGGSLGDAMDAAPPYLYFVHAPFAALIHPHGALITRCSRGLRALLVARGLRVTVAAAPRRAKVRPRNYRVELDAGEEPVDETDDYTAGKRSGRVADNVPNLKGHNHNAYMDDVDSASAATFDDKADEDAPASSVVAIPQDQVQELVKILADVNGWLTHSARASDAFSLPILISSNPFLYSSLYKAHVVRAGAVHVPGGTGHHRLQIDGYVLPTNLPEIFRLIRFENPDARASAGPDPEVAFDGVPKSVFPQPFLC